MDDGARQAPGTDRLRRNRLTDRDKELLRFLAIARYLSTEQVARLVFPGRGLSVIRERLQWLAGQGRKPFPGAAIRRITYPTPDGGTRAAWALTAFGYARVQATTISPVAVPAHADVAPPFLAHTLALNDLFVGLATASIQERVARVTAMLGAKPAPHEKAKRLAGLYARAKGLPFRWIGEDRGALPWSEFDIKAGEHRGRLIEPDATLELPAARERWFVECEMGTQPIVSSRMDRQGATLAKIERYEKFLSGAAEAGSGATFYTKAFPDAWPPTLLFLVQTAHREASVSAAIAHWEENHVSGQVRKRALTLPNALAKLLPRVGSPAAPPGDAKSSPAAKAGNVEITTGEAGDLITFFNHVDQTAREARARARERGQAVPAYPPRIEEVRRLLKRALGAARRSP
jgi:hypothetical protein